MTQPSQPAIRTELIRPFLETMLNVLKTMANLEPKIGKPFLKDGLEPIGDVTGVIGLAGENVCGSMALVFTEGALLEVSSHMLGETYTELTPDCLDCIGEMTNMISGGARAGLSNIGLKFDMAIPTMIQGHAHMVEHKTRGPVICIPFELPGGKFYIEVAFQTSN
jgi:chemotaxis protein CheX